MKECTNCGGYFKPGSINQNKCSRCLAEANDALTIHLQEMNRKRMGDWNKSISNDTGKDVL